MRRRSVGTCQGDGCVDPCLVPAFVAASFYFMSNRPARCPQTTILDDVYYHNRSSQQCVNDNSRMQIESKITQ